MIKNNKFRYIGQRLIRTKPILQPIKDYEVKIAYLESDEPKINNHKIVMADCTKVSKKYKWCCPYDFFITVYLPNIADLTEEQLEILIFHELHHIGIDDTGMEVKLYAAPHDIDEFEDIIKSYGLHWDSGGGDT